jgi:c-di-GMP-binding flagellar brake protein YcgR
LNQNEIAKRRFKRVETSSTVVSLNSPQDSIPVSGFLRDISEGGMKIQKIAVDREVRMDKYQCQFILSGLGKIQTPVEIVGFGREEDKFSKHIVRMRFTELDKESKEKIKQFVEQKQNK